MAKTEYISNRVFATRTEASASTPSATPPPHPETAPPPQSHRVRGEAHLRLMSPEPGGPTRAGGDHKRLTSSRDRCHHRPMEYFTLAAKQRVTTLQSLKRPSAEPGTRAETVPPQVRRPGWAVLPEPHPGGRLVRDALPQTSAGRGRRPAVPPAGGGSTDSAGPRARACSDGTTGAYRLSDWGVSEVKVKFELGTTSRPG